MIGKIPPKYHDFLLEIIVTMFLRVGNTFKKESFTIPQHGV